MVGQNIAFRAAILVQGALWLLAAPAYAEPVPSATLEGSVEVTSTTEGVDASTLITAADARAAFEKTLAAATACAADPKSDGAYKVAADVDGTGKITAARGVEGTDAAALACVAAALGGAALPALSSPQAVATLTLTVRLSRAEPAPVAAPVPVVEEPKPVAEPSPASTPAADAKPAADAVKPATEASTSVAPEEETKPWSVAANLTQYLGQGTFVKDSFAATPAYGYVIGVRGSYKINDMFRASLSLGGSQQLTVTNQDGNSPYTQVFYLNDLGLSGSASQLYKDEDYTGIVLGASLGLSLPISKASRAAEQIFALTPGVSLSRTFENVGPGSISVAFASSLRLVAGPQARTLDQSEAAAIYAICRDFNRISSGECLTASANTSYAFNNNLSVSYTFLDDFTVSLAFGISNTVKHYLGDSAPAAVVTATGKPEERKSSPYVQAQRNQADLTSSSISLAYAVNEHLTVSGSLATAQDPFIKSGDINTPGSNDGYSLRFPFWDFNSAASNLSTFNLDVAFTY